jgi:hypothetical protein
MTLVAAAWPIFIDIYPPAGPSKPFTKVEAHDDSIAIGGNVEGSTIGVTPSSPRGEETPPAATCKPGRSLGQAGARDLSRGGTGSERSRVDSQGSRWGVNAHPPLWAT